MRTASGSDHGVPSINAKTASDISLPSDTSASVQSLPRSKLNGSGGSLPKSARATVHTRASWGTNKWRAINGRVRAVMRGPNLGVGHVCVLFLFGRMDRRMLSVTAMAGNLSHLPRRRAMQERKPLQTHSEGVGLVSMLISLPGIPYQGKPLGRPRKPPKPVPLVRKLKPIVLSDSDKEFGRLIGILK
jgi:hypothetical protein